MFFVSVLMTLALQAPAAAGPTGEKLLHGLQSWLDQAGSMTGDFEQSMVSGAFGEGMVERGRIWIRRPGKIRWDYLDPERKVAILNGTRTLFYQEEERQMIVSDLAEGGGLLADLLAGEGTLAAHFLAERIERPDLEQGRGWFLRLRPREPGESFEEVTLFLSRKYRLKAAEVLDAAGNRMLYRFRDLKRNEGIPDAIFAFRPPEGTEILQDEPADWPESTAR